METTNNTNVKSICTEKDVLIALSKLDGEYRKLLGTQSLDNLVKLVNDKGHRDAVIENLDWCINTYPKVKVAVCKMCTLALNEKTQKAIDKKIADMVENYKGFSREERLKFSEKLGEVKKLDDSLDELKYSWNRLWNK